MKKKISIIIIIILLVANVYLVIDHFRIVNNNKKFLKDLLALSEESHLYGYLKDIDQDKIKEFSEEYAERLLSGKYVNKEVVSQEEISNILKESGIEK